MIASDQTASKVLRGFPWRSEDFVMGTSATKLERTNTEQVIREIVQQLLRELSNPGALEEFTRKGSGAHLERDLGLGSLERVELMLRLDKHFAMHLPESVVAEADTAGDLLQAVLQQAGRPQTDDRVTSAALLETPRGSGAEKPSEDLREKLARAETLTEILRIRGRADAATAHIYLYEEDGGVRTITCGELFSRATTVAAELARRGIAPGQTVAIMLPTGAEFFWTFAGTLLAGAIPVPIYPPFRADRIEEYASRQAAILRNAEARLLVTFRRAESVAKLLEPQVKSLRGVTTAERLAAADAPPSPPGTEARPVEAAPHRARAEDIALLQYTSGSTGNPKGVVLTHANLIANIRSMTEAVGICGDDVAVSWLPLYHDMGLIGAWFVPLASGIPVVILSPLAFLSRPERWLWAIHNHRGTLSPAPNFAYELCVRKIADGDIEGLDLSSWRAALNGAEPVRAETIDRFVEKFSRYGFRREALLPVYGLAEASLGVAAPTMGSGARVDRIERAPFESEGRAIPSTPGGAADVEFVSAGSVLPRMEVRIVNAGGQPVGQRIEGRLLFRGSSATSGYYRNPEATRELVREDGWLNSGDLGYVADGQIYITGRAKDVIIKGGRNLYPQEIEEIAGRVKGVRTGCVVAFGVPDETSGTERLVVTAEARDLKQRDRIAQEITRGVSEAVGLPPDVVAILPIHSIPKTSSGKLRRSETRRLYIDGKLSKPPAPAWLQIGKLMARGAVPRGISASKKFVRRSAEILYGVYALALFGVAALLVWLVLVPVRSRSFSAKLVHKSSRILLWLAAIRVQIEGVELLNEWKSSAPWIFAPNHSSYFDILVLLAILPAEARYVAKGEIVSMPLVNLMAKRSGHFAFERSSAQARIAQANEINDALRHGDSVVIYPEGTFTEVPGIRPFQLGTFKAAVDTGRPICPVALRGARELLRDKTILPKPGRITATFGPLMLPRAGDSDWHEIVRLRDETREVIARGAGEQLL
ncbi:MAG: AMP-binding protein [Candidatus Acidiferrales bacterium]